MHRSIIYKKNNLVIIDVELQRYGLEVTIGSIWVASPAFFLNSFPEWIL